MPVFSHAASDDPLGLATSNDIVLVDVSPETRRDLSDILSEQAVPLKSSAIGLRAMTEVTIQYELKSSSLVVALGVNVGSNSYRVSGLSASFSPEGKPQVTITAVKPEAGTFGTTPGTYGSITIPGGHGVVGLFGATCSQPISSSLNIRSQLATAIHHTTGVILTEGIVIYAYRKEVTIEGYTTITSPAGAIVTSNTPSVKSGREAFQTHAMTFTDYIIDN